MQLETRTYERAKTRGRVTIVKDTENPTTHVAITINYYDRESGTSDAVTEVVSLEEVQNIRQKTHQERNRLDTLITDIQAVLSAP